VVIQHADGYQTLYAHLSRIFVVVGDSVEVKDPIGKIGSTGRSTGSHLHYEIIRNGKKLDPCGFIDPTLNQGCK
jgi:murein DD-endopeptidase MepM/ murein hydrolase activator NlpD